MEYNFDEIVERKGSNSVKWDARPDLPPSTIPLWVADMDFKAAQPIQDAIRRRAEHGVFGYSTPSDDFFQATCDWFAKWHNWNIDKSLLIPIPGIVPALTVLVKALTQPGEGVLIMTPVYNCFFTSIINTCRVCIESPLKYEHNRYTIDYDNLEACAALPHCKLLILCNPHNPAGRVWTHEELAKVVDIAKRHDVFIVSDEIHGELVFPEYEYTPFATMGMDRWVSCVSPSKAFNIAGLQISNIAVSDNDLKDRIKRVIKENEVGEVNPFGIVSLIAAYRHSRDWLTQLLDYIQGNYHALKEAFESQAPDFPVTEMEGTYLAWVDVSAIDTPVAELSEQLIKDAGVWVNPGSMYGKDGEGFIRINMACPRKMLVEGVGKLIASLNEYKKK